MGFGRVVLWLAPLTVFVLCLARAQSPYSPARLSPGAVAAQLHGRALVDLDLTCQMIGYYTSIAGISSPLFSGEPGAANAYFTFRSAPFRVEVLQNGPMAHLFSRPISGDSVLIELFYDDTPDQDYRDPESFSDGIRIAVFRVRNGMTTALPPALGVNAGSMELVSSRAFTFAGLTVNIADFGQNATLRFRSTEPELSGTSRFPFAIPFAGTVLAVGGQ